MKKNLVILSLCKDSFIILLFVLFLNTYTIYCQTNNFIYTKDKIEQDIVVFEDTSNYIEQMIDSVIQYNLTINKKFNISEVYDILLTNYALTGDEAKYIQYFKKKVDHLRKINFINSKDIISTSERLLINATNMSQKDSIKYQLISLYKPFNIEKALSIFHTGIDNEKIRRDAFSGIAATLAFNGDDRCKEMLVDLLKSSESINKVFLLGRFGDYFISTNSLDSALFYFKLSVSNFTPNPFNHYEYEKYLQLLMLKRNYQSVANYSDLFSQKLKMFYKNSEISEFDYYSFIETTIKNREYIKKFNYYSLNQDQINLLIYDEKDFLLYPKIKDSFYEGNRMYFNNKNKDAINCYLKVIRNSKDSLRNDLFTPCLSFLQDATRNISDCYSRIGEQDSSVFYSKVLEKLSPEKDDKILGIFNQFYQYSLLNNEKALQCFNSFQKVYKNEGNGDSDYFIYSSLINIQDKLMNDELNLKISSFLDNDIKNKNLRLVNKLFEKLKGKNFKVEDKEFKQINECIFSFEGEIGKSNDSTSIILSDIILFKLNILKIGYLFNKKDYTNFEITVNKTLGLLEDIIYINKSNKYGVSFNTDINSIEKSIIAIFEVYVKHLKNYSNPNLLFRLFESTKITSRSNSSDYESEFDFIGSLLKKSIPITLNDFQNILREKNVAVLNYRIISNRFYIYIITKDQTFIDSYEYNESLNNEILSYEKLIVTTLKRADYQNYITDFSEKSYRLYKQLIEPIKAKIGKVQNLIIIPDGLLYRVPFETLVESSTNSNSFNSMPYLLNNYNISYATTCKSLYYQIKKQKQEVSKIAAFIIDSFTNNSSLSMNLELKKKLEKLDPSRVKVFYNSSATKNNFFKINDEYDGVLLATHAQQNLKIEESKLILWNDDLYYHELFTYPLPQLVMLGSCESSYAKNINSLEGPLNLTKAIIDSNSSFVIAARYILRDDIINNFYSELLKNMPIHNSLTENVNFTKKKIIKDKLNPHLWASLILWGI